MPLDINMYLECVLESHKADKIGDIIDEYRGKRKKIEEALKAHYGTDLYGMIYSGSYAKKTLINKKFDLDIIAPFKKSRFTSLEEMNEDLIKFFTDYRRTDSTLHLPRDQKVSIGLTFDSSDSKDFSLLSIDIVPGREVNEDEYPTTYNLNLHRKASLFEDSTWVKTNIKDQISHITGRSDERDVIKLLKIWKHENRYSTLKSFFIELAAIRAFDDNEGKVPNDLWGRLSMTMTYIKDNITDIQLKDPGNSNNIISDTLSENEKLDIKSRFENILNRIESNPENVKDYFPVNSKYPCPEEKEEAKYGTSKTSSAQIIPSGGFA